jgi:hypothetical protein
MHGDFHRDPLQVIKQIYRFAGLELVPEVESVMLQRIAAKPELSHGVHRYDVADFGMTEDDIRERFGNYIARFDLLENSSSRSPTL